MKKIYELNNNQNNDDFDKIENIPNKNNIIGNQISDYNNIDNNDNKNLNSSKNNIISICQQTQKKEFELDKNVIMDSFKSQQTTIVVQKLLMECKNETIVLIVKILKGEYRKIINDKNGNYFATDLFKICNQKERITILEELSPLLSEDCNNNYATHPIQALIEFSSCELEYKLILFSFNDYNKLLSAALNPNGSYTIQKIIVRIPEKFRTEFNFIYISFIIFVSKQKYGIVSAKKFISCTKNEGIITKVFNYIKDNFMGLAMDQYGNYLIQFLLEKWNDSPEGKEIKDLIIQNFKLMIQNKYSSYICESFIKILSKEEKKYLINILKLNEMEKTDNTYSIKIMKLLGIDIDINRNNFQIYSDFINNNNSSLNYMNQIPCYPNFQNYWNNNIHIENKYYNNNKNNNHKKKYKNNNNSNI